MSALSQFTRKSYINLETFRKNGESIKTPVWFVQQNDLIYVYTSATSGKVKRIHHNPTVNLVPSNFNGKPQWTWVPARAREVRDPGIKSLVDQLMGKKYGLWKRLFFRPSQADKNTVLEVKLAG